MHPAGSKLLVSYSHLHLFLRVKWAHLHFRQHVELSDGFCHLPRPCISMVDNSGFSSDHNDSLMYSFWHWWQSLLHFLLLLDTHIFLLLSDFKQTENPSLLFGGMSFISLHNMLMACLKVLLKMQRNCDLGVLGGHQLMLRFSWALLLSV